MSAKARQVRLEEVISSGHVWETFLGKLPGCWTITAPQCSDHAWTAGDTDYWPRPRRIA